jgi:maltokinase
MVQSAVSGFPHVFESLRRDWPPAERPVTDGYQRRGLADTRLADALQLSGDGGPGSSAVVVAADGDGLLAAPVVRIEDRWLRARAGDGASEAIAARLRSGPSKDGAFAWQATSTPAAVAGERPIGVDQTNASVVVGERIIVKWLERPGSGAERGVLASTHLAEVGFHEAPTPHGWLSWRPPTGPPVVLARADEFLPDAADGWQWCIDRALEHAGHDDGCSGGCGTEAGATLGRLVARLHLALSHPSRWIQAPADVADRATVAGWQSAAGVRLEEALGWVATADTTIDPGALRGPMVAAIAELGPIERTAIQPIHGDLHVGQILHRPAGMVVIDFDGNPILDAAARDDRQPAARDVAQLTCSLEHIGRVVDRRTDGRHRPALAGWVATARSGFLAAYREDLAAGGRPELFDPRLLRPFEVEQECRELLYAARYLPDWRYAPLRTLEGWFAT